MRGASASKRRQQVLNDVPADFIFLNRPAETRARLDPYFKKEAQAVLGTALRLKRALRPDEADMLRIVAQGGATALRKALKDPSQVLPALAGLGIALPALTSDERPPA